MSKYRLKKDANELQEYLQFRRRGSRVESVKGKGAKYNRGREKDKARKESEEWIMDNQEAARVLIGFYRSYTKGYGCEKYDEAFARAVAALYATQDTLKYDVVPNLSNLR